MLKKWRSADKRRLGGAAPNQGNKLHHHVANGAVEFINNSPHFLDFPTSSGGERGGRRGVYSLASSNY